MKSFIIYSIATLSIVLFPIVTIWSLNTLFGQNIPLNIYTWLASFWLGALVGGSLHRGVK